MFLNCFVIKYVYIIIVVLQHNYPWEYLSTYSKRDNLFISAYILFVIAVQGAVFLYQGEYGESCFKTKEWHDNR